MNLEKSKKRIAKKAKMGFQGYPKISIAYLGRSENKADEVVLTFLADEKSQSMEERFQCGSDAREDEAIQSAIVKMIERSEAKTVVLLEGVELKS
ncbi:hypothetical protein A9Q99_15475 [Gammaproteobacteria bacterium 45_16_T64]|nr:hypothetical protein A9Q99_15475 [Gammaproteobacteria bacterium 45_16_T64]